MSFYAQAWAWHQRGLKPSERLALLSLAQYADRSSWCCWPSIRRISEDIEMSDRAVILALQGLEAKGLIEIKRRSRKDSGSTSNLYTLRLDIHPPLPGKIGPFIPMDDEEDSPQGEPVSPRGSEHTSPTNVQSFQPLQRNGFTPPDEEISPLEPVSMNPVNLIMSYEPVNALAKNSSPEKKSGDEPKRKAAQRLSQEQLLADTDFMARVVGEYGGYLGGEKGVREAIEDAFNHVAVDKRKNTRLYVTRWLQRNAESVKNGQWGRSNGRPGGNTSVDPARDERLEQYNRRGRDYEKYAAEARDNLGPELYEIAFVREFATDEERRDAIITYRATAEFSKPQARTGTHP